MKNILAFIENKATRNYMTKCTFCIIFNFAYVDSKKKKIGGD